MRPIVSTSIITLLLCAGCGSSQNAAQSVSAAIQTLPTIAPSSTPSLSPTPASSLTPISCVSGSTEQENGVTIENVSCTGASLGGQTVQLNISAQFQLLVGESECDPQTDNDGNCRWTFIVGNNMSAGTCIVAYAGQTNGVTSPTSQEVCGTTFNEALDILAN